MSHPKTEGYGRDSSESPRARAQRNRDRPKTSFKKAATKVKLATSLGRSNTLSESQVLQLLVTQTSWVKTLKQSCADEGEEQAWWISQDPSKKVKKRGDNHQRLKRQEYVKQIRNAAQICEKVNQYAAAYQQAVGFQVVVLLLPPDLVNQGTSQSIQSIQLPNCENYQPLILGVRSKKTGQELLLLATPEELESTLIPSLQLGLNQFPIDVETTEEQNLDLNSLDTVWHTSIANALTLIPKDVVSLFKTLKEEEQTHEEKQRQ